MKKTSLALLIAVMIAGLFLGCSQDLTVDADVYYKTDTFCVNGKYFSSLQGAVDYIKGINRMKAAGDNDNVIYLTKDAVGPGAVIADIQGLTIDFAGYTYSFSNVTAVQGNKDGDFGLSITDGSTVTLKGLRQINLHDSAPRLTMVYISGDSTSLTIEEAPKMVVEPGQFVFWAADGASLTIGGETQIGGGVAATGTEENTPVVTFNDAAEIAVSELTADQAVVIINTSADSAISSFAASNGTVLIVSGEGSVTVDSNDSGDEASYEIHNTSAEATITVKTEGGPDQVIEPGQGVVVEEGTPTVGVATYAAAIGARLFESLEDALNEADTGDTVLMLTDTSITGDMPLVLQEESEVTIDLNGTTLTFDLEVPARAITNRGYTEIKNGSLHNALSGTYGICDNYGTLRLTNLTVTEVQGGGGAAFRNMSGGKIYVVGGTYSTDGEEGNQVFRNHAYQEDTYLEIINATITSSSKTDYPIIVRSGEALLDGVVVYGEKGAIAVEAGVLTIVDSEITSAESGDYYALYVSDAFGDSVVTIEGGLFKGTKYDVGLFPPDGDVSGNLQEGDILVYIKGGSFSGEKGIFNRGSHTETYTFELIVTGGTFKKNPSAYVAEGYVARKTGDVWVVTMADEEVAVTIDSQTINMSLVDFAKKVNAREEGYESASVELLKDVDLTGITWTPIGNSYRKEVNGTVFKGSFDGGYHTIKGLTLLETDTVVADGEGEYVFGLFGIVNGATIKNFTMTDVNIAMITTPGLTGENVAAVIGYSEGNLTLENIVVGAETDDDSVVNGSNVAGIIGRAYGKAADATIIIGNCVNYATVTASNGSENKAKASGIIAFVNPSGENVSVTIDGCSNYGTIYSEATAHVIATGIAAYGFTDENDYESITISNNSNYGSVSCCSGASATSFNYIAALCSYSPKEHDTFTDTNNHDYYDSPE